MACSRCEADPQPKGYLNPRQCAFTDDGEFTPDNWNCATIDQLLAYPHDRRCINDETIDVIPIMIDDDGFSDIGGWIVLTRYKYRGKTSAAINIGDFYPPVNLTLDIAEIMCP
jgi:hypothetical protein